MVINISDLEAIYSEYELAFKETDLDEEVYYTWRELVERDGRTGLLVPLRDPHVHEHPFDLLFDTLGDAIGGLEDFGVLDDARAGGWVLCTTRLTPVVAILSE